jgi:hypothetical protein
MRLSRREPPPHSIPAPLDVAADAIGRAERGNGARTVGGCPYRRRVFVVHGGVGKFRARDTRRLLDRANAQLSEIRT